MTKPTRVHFVTAKHFLRYIAGTSDFGIQYSNDINYKLDGYADSDWCGDLKDRKSDQVLLSIWDLGLCVGLLKSKTLWHYQLQKLSIYHSVHHVVMVYG